MTSRGKSLKDGNDYNVSYFKIAARINFGMIDGFYSRHHFDMQSLQQRMFPQN